MSRFEGDAGSPNRRSILGDEVTTNPAECRRIASQCAMWRWVDDTTGYRGLAGEPIISGHRP
jgi:transposase InsO family protein